MKSKALTLTEKDFKDIWGDPQEIKQKKEDELQRKYGKSLRKIYTDEELKPYMKSRSKVKTKKEREEIIKKWQKK